MKYGSEISYHFIILFFILVQMISQAAASAGAVADVRAAQKST